MAAQPTGRRLELGPTTIEVVGTDYEGRPSHRGYQVEVQGWNDEHVLLVIRSDDRVNEAIIAPAELKKLAEVAEREAPKW